MGEKSVLRRKLAGTRSGAEVTDRSALRAFRLGLARAAAAQFDLALAVIGARHGRMLQTDAARLLDDQSLIIVLDGPGGARGVAQLDASLCAGIVRQQTIGLVGAQSEDAPDRVPTATDAALAAPLLDDALSRAEGLVEVAADRACITGYRFGARAENLRSIGPALVADRYRVFDLTVDLGGGQRKGRLVLVFPEADRPERPPPPETETAREAERSPVLDLPAEMMAILGKLRLPLRQVSCWKVGDAVPLPAGADLSRTRLTTRTGAVVAVGQLGQARGARAVRLPSGAAAAEALEARGQVSQKEFEQSLFAVAVGDAQRDANAPASETESPAHLVAEPDAEAEDVAMAALSPEQAAQEITALAGLDDLLDDPLELKDA